MKTLLEGPGRMGSYTRLSPLFEALAGTQRQYRWLVTQWECNVYPPEFSWDPEVPPRLLSGDSLSLLAGRNDPQFIWGVLSALPPRQHMDVSDLAVEPWADGNPAIWIPEAEPQFPGAALEIVCWDSSCTIVTSSDEDVHRRLLTYFPEAKPLPPRADRRLGCTPPPR